MSNYKRKTVPNRESRPEKRPLRLPVLLGGVGVLMMLMFLFFVLKEVLPASKTFSGPALSVDKQEVNLGDQKLGTFTEVSFEITNTGDQPLRFTEAPYIEVLAGC